jgi:hypothetical protein
MRKFQYCFFLLLAGTAHAQDFVQSRVPSDREQPEYVMLDTTTRPFWTGKQINWYYNPANQPVNLVTDQVVSALQVAAARWSGMCNITFTYQGLTTVQPVLNGTSAQIDGVNVVGWGYLQGSQAAYSAMTQAWWSGGGLVDTDVVINLSQSWTTTLVEAVMTHEWGHALGLAHSDVSASIMFANPYHTAAYQRVLRGDDANGCAALYGAAATADSNRAFNWAESAYSGYLSPGPSASGSGLGYYYRYYAGTNSYVGTKDGGVYYMGSDGVIQSLGPLSNFTPQARAAGY